MPNKFFMDIAKLGEDALLRGDIKVQQFHFVTSSVAMFNAPDCINAVKELDSVCMDAAINAAEGAARAGLEPQDELRYAIAAYIRCGLGHHDC